MPRKIPQRTCMGCQAKKDKRELVRIVRSPEGRFLLILLEKSRARALIFVPIWNA